MLSKPVIITSLCLEHYISTLVTARTQFLLNIIQALLEESSRIFLFVFIKLSHLVLVLLFPFL